MKMRHGLFFGFAILALMAMFTLVSCGDNGDPSSPPGGNNSGNGTETGNGDGTGTGNDSGTGTDSGNGTGTGNDSGTGTGNDNGTGTDSVNGTGTDNGSGTGTGGNDTGTGNGTGTGGNDTGTGSGTGTGNGNDTGTDNGNGTGTGNGNGTGTGSGTGTGGGTTGTKPSIPTGVKATAESSSSISVTWNSVSGATSYKIYSGTTAGSFPNETKETNTSHTFTGLNSSTTYYFRITAVNSVGESTQSTTVSAKTEAPPLQKPNAIFGKPVVNAETTTSLTLGWPASSPATGYNLYRATSDTDIFTVVYSGSARTYKDNDVTTGVTYKYKVTATNSAGESDDSDVLTYRKL
jgi:hypothetical protein